VRESSKHILIDLPTWVKVVLSALLIFPMYFWILFPVVELESDDMLNTQKQKLDFGKGHSDLNESKKHILDEEEKDAELKEEEDTKNELSRKLMTAVKRKKRSYIEILEGKEKTSEMEHDTEISENNRPKVRRFVSLPFRDKVYMLWTAPFTKFWLNFISYVCFLMLFSLVSLWPCCGNLLLDGMLWFWTATITIEDARITYYKYFNGSQVPLKRQIIEIVIMVSFLVLFLIVRILATWTLSHNLFGYDRIYLSKAILCIYLLYFFYRTVFIFLPISHQLGPMLVRMKLMIKHDFLTYLRLFLIFMTAGGVALNAILYPFYPVDFELLKRVFIFRGFLQLFVSDKVDLERKTEECRNSNMSASFSEPYHCADLVQDLNFRYPNSALADKGVAYNCNYLSVLAWLILIQYFLLVKLFLPSLLTAMFSATGQRVNSQSEQLWMYQRYEIVVDYETRLTFPPPFTFISYIAMFFKWLSVKMVNLWTRMWHACYKCSRPRGAKSTKSDKLKLVDAKPLKNMHNYWRNMAQNFSKESEKKEKDKSKEKTIETNLNKVREDLVIQKKSMQRLNDRIVLIEKAIIQNQSYLEVIKNSLVQRSSKLGLLDRKKSTYVHILSRESPYLLTNVARYFVYEKLVPWDCVYDMYDPPFLSILFDVLKVDRMFVDDEPNKRALKENDESSHDLLKNVFDAANRMSKMSPSKSISASEYDAGVEVPKFDMMESARQSVLESQIAPSFLWNSIVNIELANARYLTIDRKSWITRIDENSAQSFPLIYSLDPMGLPRNPMGRTGLRGRGALYRYGPNHEIMAILTRWKKMKKKPIMVERKKLLEFVAVKDSVTGQTKIPGDKILGDESAYSVVCRTFLQLVFEETAVEKCLNFNEEDMTLFFAQFASQTPIDTSKSKLVDVCVELGFCPTLIYSGYIDDPRNTDNAWVEGQIWNFHFDKDDFLDNKIHNQSSKWREVSPNIRINSNEIINDVLKDIAETHNAFYN